jgi:hypothetical protein
MARSRFRKLKKEIKGVCPKNERSTSRKNTSWGSAHGEWEGKE